VNSYAAGDDLWFWLLGVESDRAFPKVCAAIDRVDLLEDERFLDARARRRHASFVIATLDEEFARYTRAELIERFDRADVWWAPINTPADVLVDPQAVAAGAFVDVPAGAGAPAHRAVATPVTFRDADGDPNDLPPVRSVPGLGEHTDAVLRDLGIGDDEIAALRASGAIT